MAWLLVAAGITTLIALLHSYLGERRIMPRLLASPELPKLRGSIAYTRSILRWAWHLTSLAWLAHAALLLAITRLPLQARGELGAIIATCLALSGLVCLLATRGRHVAWPFFIFAAVAAWLGSS
jgi:hypothetical protein